MTDKNASGGFRSAACPTCGKVFVWTVVRDPKLIMRCNQDDPNTGKRCTQKFTRSEWEYLASRQKKVTA